MQPMLRDLIRQMAGKVEYRVEEARPTPAPPAKATGSGQGR